MEVRLEKICVSRFDVMKQYKGYDNTIILKTKGGMQLSFPISIEFWEKLEKTILQEMAQDINVEMKKAINGDLENQLEYYKLEV